MRNAEDHHSESSEEEIEHELASTVNFALLAMLPPDPKLEVNHERELQNMTQACHDYALIYKPCLVWLLDNFELRHQDLECVNMSSLSRHPCPDPHFMNPKDFETKLNACRLIHTEATVKNWPHKLVYAQWVALVRAKGYIDAVTEEHISLFVPELSVY